MLKDLVRVFNKNNLHYWLDWGALLGIIRGNNLLAWDKDIDIGIFEQDIPNYNALKPQIISLGYRFSEIKPEKLLSKDDFVPRIHFNTSLLHCHKNVSFEVFVWKEVGNIAKIINCPKDIWCNLKYYKELESLDWEGVNIKIPNDVVKYLRMRYGNWEKPDQFFYKNKGKIGSQ